MPARDIRPLVGRKAKRLFALAGLRREFTVSEPIPSQLRTLSSHHTVLACAKNCKIRCNCSPSTTTTTPGGSRKAVGVDGLATQR